MEQEYKVNDVVISIDPNVDDTLREEGSVTDVMQVLDVQQDSLLVKFLNESGTYTYGTVGAESVVIAV